MKMTRIVTSWMKKMFIPTIHNNTKRKMSTKDSKTISNEKPVSWSSSTKSCLTVILRWQWRSLKASRISNTRVFRINKKGNSQPPPISMKKNSCSPRWLLCITVLKRWRTVTMTQQWLGKRSWETWSPKTSSRAKESSSSRLSSMKLGRARLSTAIDWKVTKRMSSTSITLWKPMVT